MADKPTHSESRPSWYPSDVSSDDAATEIIHTRFTADPDADAADAVVVAIVESVATLTGDAITELPPLYETVDSEALTELVATSRARNHHVDVSFVYQGCHVTVSSRGDIVAVAADR